MVDQFRSVVALLGADITDKSTEVFPTAAHEAAVDALFAQEGITHDEPLIALNPGASAPSNRWPPERFAELIDLLSPKNKKTILLLGGPSDAGAAGAIRSLTQTAYVELTGRLSVLELAAVLRRCRVLVTGDTGPMHVCAAAGTPVIALFGPAVPHESGPGYAEGNVVIRKVTSCDNCTKYKCSEENRCMRMISAAEVYEEVCKMLDSTPVSVS
jgi:ADP-heptose:LPS heptosyltransferase